MEAVVLLVDFLGDFATVLLAAASIIAFFRYRKKIGQVFRLLRLNHVNDRVGEIKKTLELILDSPIQKGRSDNLRALFGRLNGQLIPFCLHVPGLQKLQEQVAAIALDSGALNEPIKQHIIHQIVAEIEGSKLLSLNEIIGQKP